MTPEEFIKYHTERPHIYDKFKSRAIELIDQGATYLSARSIFYDLRSVNGFRKDKDDSYKIMNESSKYYVDLFEIDHPQHKGKFKRVGRLKETSVCNKELFYQ